MNMLESDRLEVTQKARDYVGSDKKILDLEWNGREIRNGECYEPPQMNASHSLDFLVSRLHNRIKASASVSQGLLRRNLLI